MQITPKTDAHTEARAIAPLTLEGAIWHYMDEKTVAAYGPWITKADHDAALAAKDAELAAVRTENERLKEDRARFPDIPDDIGRMIEANIGNLKAGKKSAEDAANKAFDRAFRAEAALAEKDKEIAALNKKFETLKQAYDRERRRTIQILGSNVGGNNGE